MPRISRVTLNEYVLGGNLTEDPTLEQVGDKQVCSATVAINERYRDRNGEWKEDTTYIQVSFWNAASERFAKLRKGDNVIIHGKIKLDQWTNKETGEKRQKHRVIANRFQYVGELSDTDDSADTNEPVETSTPVEEGNPFKSEEVV